MKLNPGHKDAVSFVHTYIYIGGNSCVQCYLQGSVQIDVQEKQDCN